MRLEHGPVSGGVTLYTMSDFETENLLSFGLALLWDQEIGVA